MWFLRLFTASMLFSPGIPCLAAPVVVDEAQLLADDSVQNALFGASAAVDRETLILGAPGANAAYSFVRKGTLWEQQQKLKPNGGPGSVGFSVSIHADTAVLGAPNETVNGLLSAGAAYVFFRIGTA